MRSQGGGHHHLPTAGAALGVVLDHLAGGQSQSLPPDVDHRVVEIDVVPSQAEQLALSEPSEPGGQDHCAVAIASPRWRES